MELLIFVLLIAVSGLTVVCAKAKQEQKNLEGRLRRYDTLVSKEEFEEELSAKIVRQENELINLEHQREQLSGQVNTLQKRLNEVEEEVDIQSFGFYKARYSFETSEGYQHRLNQIREKQKSIIKDDRAAICHVPWEVEGSRSQGKKMTRDFLRLVLRAFNGECDAAIAKVRYNNANSLETRIVKSFETLNKLSSTNRCEITQAYLKLKLQEMSLAHELQEKKQEEQEEQRRIREQMREEQKAEKEYNRRLEETKREAEQRQQALEQARREVESATGKQREKLEQKVAHLTRLYQEAVQNQQQVAARQMSKSGFIYILSNIGSFGESIYKIGMTRRLEPMNRVKDLSAAAVPFPYDIHAMIDTENAPEVERLLHQYFRDRAVNKVNERKEFFRVNLDEVEIAVQKIARETKTIKKAEIRFTKLAEAEQFRKTLAMERDGTKSTNSNYIPSWDEDDVEEEE
jgi:predicted nuclease with TOPRIM domain